MKLYPFELSERSFVFKLRRAVFYKITYNFSASFDKKLGNFYSL